MSICTYISTAPGAPPPPPFPTDPPSWTAHRPTPAPPESSTPRSARGVDRHGHVQELLVEEGNAGLDAPRGHRLVRAQAVELVQTVELAHGLFVEGAGVGGAVEVQVAAEDLVGAFARQHHLDPQGADAARHQVHRRGGAHRGHVEGLQVMDHLGERVESFLHGELELVMDGADVVGHQPGGGQIRRSLQPDAEGMEAGPPCFGPVVVLDPVGGVALRDCRDDRRVQSPGQQDAVGHIGHELAVHGGFQRFADRGGARIGGGVGVASPGAPIVAPRGAVRGIEDVTGGELGDRAADGGERLHLGSDVEAALFVVAGVEWDDPDVVARHDVPVRVGVVEDEGDDPVQTVQEGGPFLGVERQDDLAVAAGLELVGSLEPGLQLTVVVDLSVHGQDVGTVGAAERLRPVIHIHDGEPVVGRDGPLMGVDAGPVRAAVPLEPG